MQPSNTVLTLTIDLLAHHAFNHLPDDKISALHHLILRLKEPLTATQQKLLLTFWNHAAVSNLPPALLQRCNTILLQLGRRPMEETGFEMEGIEY
jgi:predicted Zn-dependent protease with MMP-like domain